MLLGLDDVVHDPYRLTAVACLAIALMGLILRGAAQSSRGAWGTLSLVLFCIAGAVLALDGVLYAISDDKWGWILAAVPSVLIVRHGTYLRLTRRRSLSTIDQDRAPKSMKPLVDRAMQKEDREFAADVLAVRYGIPAVMMFLFGVAIFELLYASEFWAHMKTIATPEFVESAQKGARFAAAGASVYVLIDLGQRSLRRDLTSGAASWSAVSLALAPLFGAVLAMIWRPDHGADGGWTYAAVYFVAGVAPKPVLGVIEEGVRRVWFGRAAAAAASPRVVALTQLRGITPEIAERLAEEGITDAYAMAMVDPLRLYRNTAFERRQILGWIDEALLLTVLPEHWQAIEKRGITGAIDLAYRTAEKDDALFDKLSAGMGSDAPSKDELVAIAELLRGDAQVALVWGLYQADDVLEEAAPESQAPPNRGASSGALLVLGALFLAGAGACSVLGPSSAFVQGALLLMLAGSAVRVALAPLKLNVRRVASGIAATAILGFGASFFFGVPLSLATVLVQLAFAAFGAGATGAVLERMPSDLAPPPMPSSIRPVPVSSIEPSRRSEPPSTKAS